mgnify:FL=1
MRRDGAAFARRNRRDRRRRRVGDIRHVGFHRKRGTTVTARDHRDPASEKLFTDESAKEDMTSRFYLGHASSPAEGDIDAKYARVSRSIANDRPTLAAFRSRPPGYSQAFALEWFRAAPNGKGVLVGEAHTPEFAVSAVGVAWPHRKQERACKIGIDPRRYAPGPVAPRDRTRRVDGATDDLEMISKRGVADDTFAADADRAGMEFVRQNFDTGDRAAHLENLYLQIEEMDQCS